MTRTAGRFLKWPGVKKIRTFIKDHVPKVEDFEAKDFRSGVSDGRSGMGGGWVDIAVQKITPLPLHPSLPHLIYPWKDLHLKKIPPDNTWKDNNI
jgi:hypothetical protein